MAEPFLGGKVSGELGLDVLPDLKKLGLVTDRTRSSYEVCRLLGAEAPVGTPKRGDTHAFLGGD